MATTKKATAIAKKTAKPKKKIAAKKATNSKNKKITAVKEDLKDNLKFSIHIMSTNTSDTESKVIVESTISDDQYASAVIESILEKAPRLASVISYAIFSFMYNKGGMKLINELGKIVSEED